MAEQEIGSILNRNPERLIGNIHLEERDIQNRVANELVNIKKDRQSYLQLLELSQQRYQNFTKQGGDFEEFFKSLPLIVQQNFIKAQLKVRIGLNPEEFFQKELERVESLERNLNIEIVTADLTNGTQDALKDLLRGNVEDPNPHIYILHSIPSNQEIGGRPLSHYSLVIQEGHLVTVQPIEIYTPQAAAPQRIYGEPATRASDPSRVIAMDSVGVIRMSTSIFDQFIRIDGGGFQFSRVESRTQYKQNPDCELKSIYLATHLLRLKVFNTEHDTMASMFETENSTSIFTPTQEDGAYASPIILFI